MKLLIAAIGKAKASSPEQQLYRDYLKRLPWKVECRELAAKNMRAEGEALLAACAGYDRLIALDENGKNISSAEFAAQIKKWQLAGDSSFAFVIGGADGLDAAVRGKADLAWSLGRATWPHMLVRALLAEQLYRAHSIISGHPYHREG